MNKQHILDAYWFRHACKEFDASRKISPDDFELILETARLSPSSFGFEPWKFIVLQNPQIREKLIPVTWGAQRTLPTASHYVIILARTKSDMMPTSEYILNLRRNVKKTPEDLVQRMTGVYQNFLESDFKLLDNDRVLFEWCCRQTYIALGNMMTTAALLGIDSCPIEGFEIDKVERVLAEEGLLEDGRFGISCMVAFGYRAQEPRPKSRQPLEQIVRWVE